MTDKEKIDRLTMLADSAIFWLGFINDELLQQKHKELKNKLEELKNEQ